MNDTIHLIVSALLRQTQQDNLTVLRHRTVHNYVDESLLQSSSFFGYCDGVPWPLTNCI